MEEELKRLEQGQKERQQEIASIKEKLRLNQLRTEEVKALLAEAQEDHLKKITELDLKIAEGIKRLDSTPWWNIFNWKRK